VNTPVVSTANNTYSHNERYQKCPLTYQLCNGTERPGVAGGVGVKELWIKL